MGRHSLTAYVARHVSLCPSCANGDCYRHQHDYMAAGNVVTLCRCADTAGHHGKRAPRVTDQDTSPATQPDLSVIDVTFTPAPVLPDDNYCRQHDLFDCPYAHG